jgi:uncharacterized protein (TIGR02147 family)
LQGQRNPGHAITTALVGYFQFSKREGDYFRDLVRLAKSAGDPGLSVLLMERLARNHPEGSVRLLNDREFSLLSNWHYYAVRERTHARDFVENAEALSERFLFRVTPAEVRTAIQTLLALGLLKRDRAGRLVAVDKEIESTTDVATEALRRHHEQTLAQAGWALRGLPTKDREITNTTFVMKSVNFAKAKEFLRKLKQEFVARFEEDGGDTVVRVQMQWLPLTKEKRNGSY